MHVPVLLNEVIGLLNPQPGQRFIDGTFGAGGHSAALADRVGLSGGILAIEWDQEFIELQSEQVKNPNIVIVQGSYAEIEEIARTNGFVNADGVLLDLGVSSWHLEASGRGFTFRPPEGRDEPLDMRYSRYGKDVHRTTAAEIVNTYSEDQLYSILKEYGQERYARSIARAIVRHRRSERIITVTQLVDVIRSAVSGKYQRFTQTRSGRGRIHFATRTFQALRIEVNEELDNLARGIKGALRVVRPGAGVAVISFHSLEDRIVKTLFREGKARGEMEIVTKKPVTPSIEERHSNPRARSAKLRVARTKQIVT